MDNLVEIVLQAIDNASDVFNGVSSSAEEMGTSLEQSADEAAASIDNVETEAEEAGEAIDAMADLMAFQALSEYVNQLADAMWQLADKAGTVQDSWTRVGLAAEGAGIPIDQMKGSISSLAAETGRAGSSIRESFIQMSSAGITSLDAMNSLFEGASAQAFILGTDVESLANKFSGMAMKSSIAERTLKGTGITVEELGQVLGIEGATIDDVNAKWETMDTNARAAALGQAAAMNEGKEANEEYKNSWEGLQAQIEIAKGKLEVLLGNILLPVLIPTLQAAGNVLSWLGDTLSWIMSSPLGGFISVIGSAAAGLILLMAAVTTVSAGMGFFTASLMPAIAASWALIAPWLPFIAAAALIVAAIYEIGKAFGWWDDASGMVEAISAGIMRLWNAFINHPDVQAIIGAISDAWGVLVEAVGAAWEAVKEFFGITEDGSFDIVHELIMALGAAWESLTAPIRLVIDTVQALISIFQLFSSGQMDLPSLIMLVLTQLYTLYTMYFTMIVNAVISWGTQILSNGINAATSFVNGIISRVSQLPGKAYTQLIAVVNRIVSAGQQWVSNAKSKAQAVIDGAVGVLSGLAGAISSALSGVTSAITAPFQSAYNSVCGIVDNIKSKVQEGMDWIGSLGAAGGDMAAGGDFYAAGGDNTSTLDINYNINLDLSNVPSNMSTNDLISALSNRTVLSALTGNKDFQELDAKVKASINAKNSRARGV